MQYATLAEPKSPTVYQAKAVSDLKPVECWKPKETFVRSPSCDSWRLKWELSYV